MLKKLDHNKLVRILSIIFGVAIIIIITITSSYLFNFNNWFSAEGANWGTFGDYFGGTLNPILSFLSLMALFLTIILQNRELEATRKEIEQSRIAQEQQAKNLEKQIAQNIEKEKRDLIFKMLGEWNNKNMHEYRLSAWSTLNELKAAHGTEIDIDTFKNSTPRKYTELREICQFLANLSLLLKKELIHSELLNILFKDSVSPWLDLLSKIKFDNQGLENDVSIEVFRKNSLKLLNTINALNIYL